jgi:hypothetical protein
MKLSKQFRSRPRGVLISPTIVSATGNLSFNAEEPSLSMSMYDLVQKTDKNIGKLTDIYISQSGTVRG